MVYFCYQQVDRRADSIDCFKAQLKFERSETQRINATHDGNGGIDDGRKAVHFVGSFLLLVYSMLCSIGYADYRDVASVADELHDSQCINLLNP